MNRKIFMFERKPTYQEDPSFYAERVIGTVPNVFKRQYTSNQTEKVDGLFTGVDVTVNVPSFVPVCDRVYVNGTTVMLTSFNTGTASSVNIPSGYGLMWISPLVSGIRNVMYYFRSSASSSFTIPLGYRYYLFQSAGTIAKFQNASGDLISLLDNWGTDTYYVQAHITPALMSFSI